MEPQQANPMITILAAVVSSLGSILVTWMLASAKAKRREKAVFTHLVDDVKAIKHQVFTNGGTSLRDAIGRIERALALESKINRAYHFHNPNPLWHCNVHGSFLWCNPAMAKLLGVSKQDILQNGWMMMLHEEDKANVRDELKNAANYGNSMVIEFRVYRPNKYPMLKLRTHWQAVVDEGNQQTVAYIGTVVSHEEVKA